MKRTFAVLLLATALLASACGANGSGGKTEEGEGTTKKSETTEVANDASFEKLTDLCADGDFKVKADEAGKGTDKLYLAVANDRSAQIRTGLNKVLYDSSVAFADWCNANGGIGGLQIEIVDADAALFNVEAAMTTVCSDAFAMVGGGFVMDDLEFSGKDASDFHKCKMIDIPGFAVSVKKTDSNGQIQPVPNPGTSVANTWMRDFKKLYPEDAKTWAVAYGEIPSLEAVKDKYLAAAKDVGLDNVGTLKFPAINVADWTPYARRFIDMKATSLTFVAEVENLTGFLSKAVEQGWKGTPLVETNMYEPMLSAEPAAEGTVLRMTYHPLEEKEMWPGIQKYLDINAKYVPGGDLGGLGIQSTSAWLLFVTAANACGKNNGGEISRDCILEEAAKVKDWTGGGLHGPQDPEPASTFKASPCSMLLIVKDGKFERLYPKIDGTDDDFEGFHCPKDGVSQVPANEGKGAIDPSRPI